MGPAAYHLARFGYKLRIYLFSVLPNLEFTHNTALRQSPQIHAGEILRVGSVINASKQLNI